MNANSTTFADLLEDLIEKARIEQDAPPVVPSTDFLDLAERVSPSASCGEVERTYQELNERVRIEAEAVSVLERITVAPSIEPDDIALELGLAAGHRVPPDLDRARREFAFRNHPDRVAPEHRDHAMKRMQIANRMIDEAKARWRG